MWSSRSSFFQPSKLGLWFWISCPLFAIIFLDSVSRLLWAFQTNANLNTDISIFNFQKKHYFFKDLLWTHHQVPVPDSQFFQLLCLNKNKNDWRCRITLLLSWIVWALAILTIARDLLLTKCILCLMLFSFQYEKFPRVFLIGRLHNTCVQGPV